MKLKKKLEILWQTLSNFKEILWVFLNAALEFKLLDLYLSKFVKYSKNLYLFHKTYIFQSYCIKFSRLELSIYYLSNVRYILNVQIVIFGKIFLKVSGAVQNTNSLIEF